MEKIEQYFTHQVKRFNVVLPDYVLRLLQYKCHVFVYFRVNLIIRLHEISIT